MTKLGLTINETKTALRDARQEHFDFLGYSFEPHYYRKDGHWYLGASPSSKSVQRLKTRVAEIMVPSNIAPWDDGRIRLNAGPANAAADNHVAARPPSFTSITEQSATTHRRRRRIWQPCCQGAGR